VWRWYVSGAQLGNSFMSQSPEQPCRGVGYALSVMIIAYHILRRALRLTTDAQTILLMIAEWTKRQGSWHLMLISARELDCESEFNRSAEVARSS